MKQIENGIQRFPPLEQDDGGQSWKEEWALIAGKLETVYRSDFPDLPEPEWAFARGSTGRHSIVTTDGKVELGIRSPLQDADFEANLNSKDYRPWPKGFLGLPKKYFFASHPLSGHEVRWPEKTGAAIETHLYIYFGNEFAQLVNRGHPFAAARLVDVCLPILGDRDAFEAMVPRALAVYFEVSQNHQPPPPPGIPFTVSEALRRLIDIQLAVEPHRLFGIINIVRDEKTWDRNLALLRQRTKTMLRQLISRGKLKQEEIDGLIIYRQTEPPPRQPISITRLRRAFLIQDLAFLLPSLFNARPHHLRKIGLKLLWASIYAASGKNNCQSIFNSLSSPSGD